MGGIVGGGSTYPRGGDPCGVAEAYGPCEQLTLNNMVATAVSVAMKMRTCAAADIKTRIASNRLLGTDARFGCDE